MELEIVEHISEKDKREKIIQLTVLRETLYETYRKIMDNSYYRCLPFMLSTIMIEKRTCIF